jgi:hypothetical protein
MLPFDLDGVGWHLPACRACANAIVDRALAEGAVSALDRGLRGALLNIHGSRFNRMLVRSITHRKRRYTFDARICLLKRLVRSGFDLWEVPLRDPLTPMLGDLLQRLLEPVADDDRAELARHLIRFVIRNWHRLRSLPHDGYVIREICRVAELREAMFEAVRNELEAGRGAAGLHNLVIDIMPLLSPKGRLVVADWIRGYVSTQKENARSAPASDWLALAARLDGSADAVRGDAHRERVAGELSALDRGAVLDEFERALGSAPMLPIVAPEWRDEVRPRSMLAALPGGFQRMTVANFGRSLRGQAMEM